jgi:uncharacterized tellurite resistance protein B-like protein
VIETLRELLGLETEQSGGRRGRLSEEDLPLATAALLVEMSRADHDAAEEERALILQSVQGHFGLPVEEAEQLLQDAEREADAAVSLHDYTRLLNEALEPAQKSRLLTLLWQVAQADGRVDKYEEYLVRKVADLLYVPHGEFIRTKLSVLVHD